MARKKAAENAVGYVRPEESAKPQKNDSDIIATMRERYQRCQDYDSDLSHKALEDIKFAFVEGSQWEPKLREFRKKRPCYEFNRLRQMIRKVLGDQRQNRPSIKVRGTEESDKPTADVLQGLIRNIESVSNAERAYDGAFEMMVTCGKGFWRVNTKYSDDEGFEQDIEIKEIRNPLAVQFDPSASEWDRRDAMFAFLIDYVSKDEFETRWPDKQVEHFESGQDWVSDWFSDEKIRIAEYWVREPATKTIVLLSDGRTVEKTPEFDRAAPLLAQQGIAPIQQRECKTYKVVQYMVSGAQVLEGPNPWAGKFIPIVPAWGDMVNMDGRDVYSGMVRFSKDAQRTYNFHRTTGIERVANTPQAPLLVTPKMITGYENLWNSAASEPLPYLPYNIDPLAPTQKPFREQPPDVPQAMMALAQLDSDDLKATTGVYDPSLGAPAPERSGRAILARQKQSDVSTFSYIDNLGRSLKYTAEILIDLIPKIYDTQRMVRILGADGADKAVTLNKPVALPDGTVYIENDLSRGKYDVTVTIGPGFATQRMEMADTLTQMAQAMPQIAPMLADLIVSSQDWPGSEQVVERLKAFQMKQGLIPPPPDQPPPPPDPMIQAQHAMTLEKIKQEEFKTQQEELKVAELRAKVHTGALDNAGKEMGLHQQDPLTGALVAQIKKLGGTATLNAKVPE